MFKEKIKEITKKNENNKKRKIENIIVLIIILIVTVLIVGICVFAIMRHESDSKNNEVPIKINETDNIYILYLLNLLASLHARILIANLIYITT